MLEEDFGTQTSKLFSLVSSLKYLREPKPDPWEMVEVEDADESKDDVVRIEIIKYTSSNE